MILITVNVDDFLILASHQHLIDTFYFVFATKYVIKRLGRPSLLLVCTINFPSDGRIIIIQPSLVLTKIANASIAAINERQNTYNYGEDLRTPMPHETALPSMAPKLRQIVGDLRYLCDRTRPDLPFITEILGGEMHLPTTRHWYILKAEILYLITTKHLGIRFLPGQKRPPTLRLLHEYDDATFGGQQGDRKSTSGLMMKYNGAPFYWQSRKQQVLTMRTDEAEYISIKAAVKGFSATNRLCVQTGNITSRPILVKSDNQSAADMIDKNTTQNVSSSLTRGTD